MLGQGKQAGCRGGRAISPHDQESPLLPWDLPSTPALAAFSCFFRPSTSPRNNPSRAGDQRKSVPKRRFPRQPGKGWLATRREAYPPHAALLSSCRRQNELIKMQKKIRLTRRAAATSTNALGSGGTCTVQYGTESRRPAWWTLVGIASPLERQSRSEDQGA